MWRGFKKEIKMTHNPITKRPDDFVLSFSLYPPLLSLVLYACTHMHVHTHTHAYTQASCIKLVVQFYRLLSMHVRSIFDLTKCLSQHSFSSSTFWVYGALPPKEGPPTILHPTSLALHESEGIIFWCPQYFYPWSQRCFCQEYLFSERSVPEPGFQFRKPQDEQNQVLKQQHPRLSGRPSLPPLPKESFWNCICLAAPG